jgi:hypothetical protein
LNAFLLFPDAARGLVLLEVIEFVVVVVDLRVGCGGFVGEIELIVIVWVGEGVQASPLPLMIWTGY